MKDSYIGSSRFISDVNEWYQGGRLSQDLFSVLERRYCSRDGFFVAANDGDLENWFADEWDGFLSDHGLFYCKETDQIADQGACPDIDYVEEETN